MNTIDTKCKNCGEIFQKRKSDWNKSEKKGRPHFCDLSCFYIWRNKNSPRTEKQNNPTHFKDLVRRDEFSPFRYYVKQANLSLKKTKYGEPNITVEYLKDLWEEQKGKCIYTNIKMYLPKTTNAKHIKVRTIKKASLDRIDPKKGYVKGNVQFVCLGINLAKNSFSHEEMIEFIKEVKES